MIDMARMLNNVDTYRRLMGELGRRVERCNEGLQEVRSSEDINRSLMVLEGCYLQVRFCCELIALGLAALHEPLGYSLKFKKMYHAINILEALDKLKPDFFPVPLSDFKVKDGRIQGLASGHPTLDIKSVEAIYNRCGEVLHRSRPVYILENRGKQYSVVELDEWLIKLRWTLRRHTVYLVDQYQIVAEIMFDAGDASVYLVNKLEVIISDPGESTS